MTARSEKRKVDVYARFLPELIIENVAEGKLADIAGLEQFNCAVMFADISGFTPLAESFASEGAVGAEKLTATLNDYFSHLVGIIQEHGGDVVKFAGDAVLAIWKDGAELKNLAFASWRASQCGLEIQKALKSYRAGNVKLSLRVAVGAGAVNIIHVGGVFNRWEFLIAGKPLEQVGAVSDDIEPGTVGLSVEVLDLLAQYTDASPQYELISDDVHRLDTIALIEKRRNRPLLSLQDEQAPLLRSYLPAAVTHRLDASLDAFLGELRRITILFVNLPGIDYQTPLHTAQEIMIALQESCYKFEGSINKLSVDDKGVSLLAALGLPPLAHEDDPDRGIKAALTINNRLTSMGIRSSIGVSSGRVYCGVVGSDLRREYTIMGDSVNLAARLMQNANGGVLCDSASFSRASADIIFAEPKFIKLKGKANPEQVHQPLSSGKSVQDGDSAPMIGRHEEKQLLKSRLEHLVAGDVSSIVFLEADAGYGKSRLTDDFIQTVQSEAISLFRTTADAIESATPYFAIRDLLFGALGINALTPAEDIRSIVEALLPEAELIHLLPLISSIIPVGIAESAFTQQLEGEARANQTARVIIELIKRSRVNQATVIIFDDTHWLDSASWGVVVALVREVKPLMLMLVTRPVSSPTQEMRKLLGSASTEHIKMDRMSESEIVELVCTRLGVRALPDIIARLILDRTDGHPYFSEEMAYALRDNKVIEIKDGNCLLVAITNANSLDDIDIPASIEGIITSRIDRLSPAQALTIKVASVIGRTFSLKLLQELHPVSFDLEKLREELLECGRLHLTPLDTPGDDANYIFKHMITREVSYSLLLNNQTKSLHAKLAGRYEADPKTPHSLLAYHWELAECPDKALHYLVLAIDQALEEFSNGDAVLLIGRALKLIEKHGAPDIVKGHLLRCRGDAMFCLGQLDDAEIALREAIVTLGFPLPSNNSELVLGMLKQAYIQYRFAKRKESLPEMSKSAATVAQQKMVEAADAYSQLQIIYYYKSDNLRLVYTAVKGANLGCLSGSLPRSLVRTNANLLVVFGLIPLRKVSAYYLSIAEEQARLLNHPPTSAWVDVVKGTYQNGLGLWQESEENFNKALAIAEGNGDESLRGTTLTAKSKMLLMAGRYADALSGFESIYPAAIVRNDPQALCWSLLGQARSYFRLGRLAEISVFLAEAEPLLPGLPFAQRIEHLSLSALKYLHDGQIDEAIIAIEQCLRLFDRPSQSMNIFACTPLSIAIFEVKRRRPDTNIKKWWGKTRDFMRAYSSIFPVGLPVLHYQTGMYESLCGNLSRAVKCWRKALNSSIDIDIPYIVVASVNALQRVDPGTLAIYRASYDSALLKMGVEEVADSLGVTRN
jgi:class 3 adenylate cyclase/tetratricopeptide (TPR) repeat protein